MFVWIELVFTKPSHNMSDWKTCLTTLVKVRKKAYQWMLVLLKFYIAYIEVAKIMA